MPALIELLYSYMLDNWHLAEGLLDRDEYQEYQACCHFEEELQACLKKRMKGEEIELLETYLKNAEQAQDTAHRLCFMRGLAMGLSLGNLATEN